MRPIRLGTRGDRIERLADGSLVLSCPEPLAPIARSYTQRIEHWARVAGDRVFLAQRTPDGAGWRTITYAETFARARRVGQGLLDRGLSAERPLMILSGNDIEHALVAFGALHAGIPYSPISVGFSLLSRDHAKLRHCWNLLTPGLVYVTDAQAFARAIDAVVPADFEIVCAQNPIAGRRVTPLQALLDTGPTAALDAAAAAVRGDTIARILFTSGSTNMPKGAINTHKVLCANMQMTVQVWPFLLDEPPVVCDWLPWNHTFGGQQILGLVLQSGGTLYIDDGRPMPGQIEKTVRNLKEVRPTYFVSVPAGFEILQPFLESDPALRDAFFGRMKMLYYSAASLPDPVTDAYQRLAAQATGHRIFTASGYGATETGPLAFGCNWDTPRKGIVGLPVPGMSAKLVPNNGKLEVRVKGEAVFPGYFRQPELTAKAFDADGWYCLGDALRFADPDDVREGMIYDGRVAEDFKLRTGTWVNVGPLRTLATNELSPLVHSVLVCGHDRTEIGLLVFPEIEACRRVAGLAPGATLAEVLGSDALMADFRRRLAVMAAHGTSSSNRVARLRISDVPLVDVEVTDKNTLSFNVVLARRKEEVDDLFSANPGRLVLVADKVGTIDATEVRK